MRLSGWGQMKTTVAACGHYHRLMATKRNPLHSELMKTVNCILKESQPVQHFLQCGTLSSGLSLAASFDSSISEPSREESWSNHRGSGSLLQFWKFKLLSCKSCLVELTVTAEVAGSLGPGVHCESLLIFKKCCSYLILDYANDWKMISKSKETECMCGIFHFITSTNT